jgi:hypothetical protein
LANKNNNKPKNNKRKLLNTSAARRYGSKKGKKNNNNRPGEGKTEYKILPPKVLSVMKKNIVSMDENSDTVTKELKGATKKVVKKKDYLVERAGQLDQIMEVDCLDGITELFTLRVPTTPSRKMKRCDLAQIMVDIWSVLQFAASDGLIRPDMRTPLMNFIKIMEKAEEEAREEMKCDGENNNVTMMETEDGALPESEQEPAEGSVMMVDEVFNENDSQKLNGLQFNLRKKKIVLEVCLTSATR